MRKRKAEDVRDAVALAAEAALAVAYSYIRFSSRKQEEGDSLRRQMALAEEWSARTGIPLDRSRKWHDLGRSAFLGEHRHNPDRNALAAFLKMVEDGRIARGSYLLIESFDRLTREDIQPALSLVLNLLQAGIKIVQLSPEMTFDSKSDALAIIVMIVELRRGNSESALKSQRVGQAWRAKKDAAAKDKAPIGRGVPSWLRLGEDGYELIPEAAEAVRRVFRMATDGYGITAIAKKLNGEGLPPITARGGHVVEGQAGPGKKGPRGRHWPRSYVAKLLGNRSVLGEYQPHTGKVGARKPVGPPIEGYFPPVVTEAEWHAAHAGMAQRRGKAGRPTKGPPNIFTGLLFDARTGGAYHRGEKGDGPCLIPYRGTMGLGPSVTFPYPVFERAVLSFLREIDPRELLDVEDGEARHVAEEAMTMAGRLAQLEAELSQIAASLTDEYSPRLDAVLRKKEEESRRLNEELKAARQAAARPLPEAWGECQGIIGTLDASADRDASLIRLRAALRRIVERVTVLAVPRGATRLAAVQIHFAGGRVRDYLILSRKASGGARNIPKREGYSRAWSMPRAEGEAPLDLRRQDDARALEARLLALDLAGLGGPPA